jgi:hypothetical protein
VSVAGGTISIMIDIGIFCISTNCMTEKKKKRKKNDDLIFMISSQGGKSETSSTSKFFEVRVNYK